MPGKTVRKDNGGDFRPRFPVHRYILFGALVLIFHVPLWFFPDCTLPFQKFMVTVVGFLISASGLQAVQDGVSIHLSHGHWDMTQECTAISAIMVFASLVLVYPSSLKSKAIGLPAGTILLVLANTLRLFTLAWATELFPRYANLAHDYVWQVAFLLVIVILWLVWIQTVVSRENDPALSC